jgi:hypothetical protein
MNLSHAMGTTGIIQDALGRSGLTGIDVGHDADVPGIFQIFVHLLSFLEIN